MEKINIINKKKLGVCVGLFFLLILLIILCITLPKNKNEINAVVLAQNAKLYSKPELNDKKIKQEIEENTDITIIGASINDSKEWYKVKINGKKGYVLSENVRYYKQSNASKVLVADFSSHNFKNVFDNKNDVEAFLLKYDISDVYIRAGGRGYGEDGNFYTDSKYKEFASACEFLGIQYGYYFLDESLTEAEIIAEVEFIDKFMKKNQSKLCTLPLALDIENHDGKGRCDDIWDSRSSLVSKLLKKLDNLRI